MILSPVESIGIFILYYLLLEVCQDTAYALHYVRIIVVIRPTAQTYYINLMLLYHFKIVLIGVFFNLLISVEILCILCYAFTNILRRNPKASLDCQGGDWVQKMGKNSYTVSSLRMSSS